MSDFTWKGPREFYPDGMFLQGDLSVRLFDEDTRPTNRRLRFTIPRHRLWRLHDSFTHNGIPDASAPIDRIDRSLIEIVEETLMTDGSWQSSDSEQGPALVSVDDCWRIFSALRQIYQ